MHEFINRAGKFTAAILLILVALAACASPAVNPKPVSPPPPGISQPEIMNIIGAQEWNPGKENTLLCAARDPDGNPLTYTWAAENGTIKGDGQKVTWLPPDTTGDYEISVKIDNGKGGVASFSKRFSVVNPPPPEQDKTIYLKMSVPSTTTAVTQGRVRSFFTIEVQCVIEGADPKDLTYTWSATGGKLLADNLAEGKASRVGWIAPSGGEHYKITVLVQDKSGNQALGEVDMEVLCCTNP